VLFQTALPPQAERPEEQKKKKQDKKASKTNKATVVHEFANTRKHASFLKSGTIDPAKKPTAEFVEGKGYSSLEKLSE